MRNLSDVIKRMIEVVPDSEYFKEELLDILAGLAYHAPEDAANKWGNLSFQVADFIGDTPPQGLNDWQLALAKIFTNCEDMDDDVWKQQILLPRNADGTVPRP